MNKIITISRQYASGGSEVAEKLAMEYGIPFYDRALIARAAKESGFAEAAFDNMEMKATNSFLYSIAMGLNAYGSPDLGYTHLSIDDRIYIAQSEVIKKVADEGPCIIVGRCADYILRERKDVINVFIWSSMENRIKRTVARGDAEPEKAGEIIIRMDKRRENYYNYHAVAKWGTVTNYHLSIQNDFSEAGKAAEVIKKFISKME